MSPTLASAPLFVHRFSSEKDSEEAVSLFLVIKRALDSFRPLGKPLQASPTIKKCASILSIRHPKGSQSSQIGF